MIPDSPGRWLFEYADGRQKVFWLDRSHHNLWVIGEDDWPKGKPYSPSTVTQLTELVTEMKWGRWIGRVGDLSL